MLILLQVFPLPTPFAHFHPPLPPPLFFFIILLSKSMGYLFRAVPGHRIFENYR